MSVSPEKITAVILAGGFGTRIKHLLGDLPKPMAPVNGRPFLEWVVRYLAAQKIRQRNSVHRPSGGNRRKPFSIAAGEKCPCELRAGNPAARNGRRISERNPRRGGKSGTLLVLNGDSLAPAPLDGFFQSLDDPKISGAILGVRVPDASRFGTILQNANGDLTGFNEKKPGAGIINAGIYLFRASIIESFPDKTPLSFETEVFPALIAGEIRLKVCVTDAPFLDIGTPESLPLAEEFIRRNAEFFEP